MSNCYTTAQAARLCGLSRATIQKSFDSGRLAGWKVPGSRYRRIPFAALHAFIKANNLPMPAEFEERTCPKSA